jgi:muconate cycloisomerase
LTAGEIMSALKPFMADAHADDDRGAEIIAVDCFPLHLPMRKPMTTASHATTFGEVLYVRIRTRDGAEGWGESGIDPTMSGETLPGMVAAVEQHLKPRLLKRSAFERVVIARDLQHHLYANGGARAALDMALLDLIGRRQGVPAVELLGGISRRAVTILRLVGGARETTADVEETAALHAQGYRAFKLKVGIAPIDLEASTMLALRERLGPDILLSADANMAWNVAQARRFNQLIAPANPAFVEQPVPAGDTARMRAVSQAGTVPIGADEALHSIGDILALAQVEAIGGVSLKSAKLGGPTLLAQTAIVANAIGLSVNIAMLVESSLASAAMLHAACAAPQIDWCLSLGCLLLTDDPTGEPLRCCDGIATLPGGSGLGVTVDEKRLRSFAAS